MNFNKKNLGMLAVVLIAVIVLEGTGLAQAPKDFVAAITAKVKGLFSGLFNKSA